MSKENGKVCCSCGHNIRYGEIGQHIKCTCDIDGHNIDYLSCMEHWCRHWKRDRKWDKITPQDAIDELKAIQRNGVRKNGVRKNEL